MGHDVCMGRYHPCLGRTILGRFADEMACTSPSKSPSVKEKHKGLSMTFWVARWNRRPNAIIELENAFRMLIFAWLPTVSIPKDLRTVNTSRSLKGIIKKNLQVCLALTGGILSQPGASTAGCRKTTWQDRGCRNALPRPFRVGTSRCIAAAEKNR